MSDEKTPVDWYAVVTTGSDTIQPYLDRFELLADPKLLPFEDEQRLAKLTYSGFAGCTDYEDVLKEAREMLSVLTGTLRIRQGPAALSILNIVGVFEDGREKKYPPHGRANRVSWGNANSAEEAGSQTTAEH
jgi:hypothetical protein